MYERRQLPPVLPNHCVDDDCNQAGRFSAAALPVPGDRTASQPSVRVRKGEGRGDCTVPNGIRCPAGNAWRERLRAQSRRPSSRSPALGRKGRRFASLPARMRISSPRLRGLTPSLPSSLRKAKIPLFIFFSFFNQKIARYAHGSAVFFLGSATCLARDPGALRCPPGAGYRLRDWG